MLKDSLIFLREFFAEFESTGTCFPSSKWAAEALTKPLSDRREPLRILEVGPGSGPVTVQILDQMHKGDKLVVCEINPRFMKALKEKLNRHERFHEFKPNISFFQGPVQNLPEVEKFDVIVCAIPFLNLEKKMVEEIFEKFKKLSTPETILTYYEYMGLRSLGKVVSPPTRRKRIQELDLFFKSIFEVHDIQRKRVWRNFLPINVYTVRVAA